MTNRSGPTARHDHRALVRRGTDGWWLTVVGSDGAFFGTDCVGGLAEAQSAAELLVRKQRGADRPSVVVDVEIPPATADRLHIAQELCVDAKREIEAAIHDLEECRCPTADIDWIIRNHVGPACVIKHWSWPDGTDTS